MDYIKRKKNIEKKIQMKFFNFIFNIYKFMIMISYKNLYKR